MEHKVIRNIPTVFIIFGATGDLMSKKIIPALFRLYIKGKLPKLFKIIGFSRRDISEEKFLEFVRDIIESHKDTKAKNEDIESFLKLLLYQRGDFEKITAYKSLASSLGNIDGHWNACSNKLFYLAIPPKNYQSIFEHLASSGLTLPCSPEEGWTRIIVEKPFGNDLKTAQKLDSLLGKLFKEDQLYRIDHYLAKEMLQNILSFRFSNNLFEDTWNKNFIEKIEIRLLENFGVETRGIFYDSVGALRDVGQNHVLQILAMLTMDQPLSFDVPKVRKRRFQVLNQLEIMSTDKIKTQTFRGQYKGYRDIEGVHKDSNTETYFKVIAHINSERWQGVPVILEAGKKLPKKKEIIVTFKHPTPCLCPADAREHYKNRVVFSLDPKEEISVEFWIKKPGLEYEMQKQKLSYLYRDARRKIQYIEEYEKLLLDCIMGNQLLFINTEEVLAMWRFIDPIICAWKDNKVPLHLYVPDKKKILTESDEYLIKDQPSKKEIGIIGLGKMGKNIAERLVEKGWQVNVYNRTFAAAEEFVKNGSIAAHSVKELVESLSTPRTILLSLPAGDATEKMIEELLFYLNPKDIIIDGANGFYKDAIKNGKNIELKGLKFLDAGISGGPGGARNGACIMIGGKKETYQEVEFLFKDMAKDQAVQFFEGYGAGHFVKMIHNGIEYGMMQALAEGFDILKQSPYNLDLGKVTEIYNNGSVIESRLVGWLKEGFKTYGQDLEGVSSTVAHTGEGSWTVQVARELKIKAQVIEDALQFRIDSEKNPSYTGKLLSTLRNMFGGHSIK